MCIVEKRFEMHGARNWCVKIFPNRSIWHTIYFFLLEASVAANWALRLSWCPENLSRSFGKENFFLTGIAWVKLKDNKYFLCLFILEWEYEKTLHQSLQSDKLYVATKNMEFWSQRLELESYLATSYLCNTEHVPMNFGLLSLCMYISLRDWYFYLNAIEKIYMLWTILAITMW